MPPQEAAYPGSTYTASDQRGPLPFWSPKHSVSCSHFLNNSRRLLPPGPEKFVSSGFLITPLPAHQHLPEPSPGLFYLLEVLWEIRAWCLGARWGIPGRLQCSFWPQQTSLCSTIQFPLLPPGSRPDCSSSPRRPITLTLLLYSCSILFCADLLLSQTCWVWLPQLDWEPLMSGQGSPPVAPCGSRD